jgi:DNA-binding PucR family transcriptional regulator
MNPGSLESAQVIRDAARNGLGAVVVKVRDESIETLAAVADVEGIALVVADEEMAWRQLDALISSALSSIAQEARPLSEPPVGDLFALANAIAATVGGATAIEDLQERVLAYSTLPGQPIDEDRREGILGRQVPELPENSEQYAAIFRAQGAITVPAASWNRTRADGSTDMKPSLDRLAVAVRAGFQPLGTIWVVDATGELAPDAPQALEHAAEIAALHLLRARSTADLTKQQMSELLRRLLTGGADAPLLAGQLGLGKPDEFVVLAFQPEPATSSNEISLTRVFDLIAMHCDAHNPGTRCTVIGDTVFALFAGAAGFERREAPALCARLVERAKSALHVGMRAAVGSAVEAIGQIPRSRHDAELVLLLLANHPSEAQVASARDVRSRVTVLELAQALRDMPWLISEPARMMRTADARSGTDYAKTLLTYLDLSRDSAATASVLSLHQNTLRYRLRRAQELFGVDLNNPDDTLTLWLSLRVLEFD